MATTHLPDLAPIEPTVTMAYVQEQVRAAMESAQGDSDKAGEVEAVCWYDGQVDALKFVEWLIAGSPEQPTE